MKRSLLSILSLLVLLCMLVACVNSGQTPADGASTSAQQAPSATNKPQDAAIDPTKVDESAVTKSEADISKHLDLKMYAANDASDEALKAPVMELLNAILEKEINVTLTWTNIDSSDLQNRYPLLLASDEIFDIIYTASWLNYNDHARNKAFIAMDDYLTYAPQLISTVPAHFWAGMTADDGHYYAMPSTWQYPQGSNFIYREDLRLKYGSPEIKDMDTWEAYLSAIQQNSTTGGLMPINLGLGGTVQPIWENYHGYLGAPSVGTGNNQLFYGYIHTPEKGFHCYYFDPDFPDWLVKMRSYLDAGYWSRSALSQTTSAQSNFENGLSASYIGHYDSARGGINTTLKLEAAREEGWKCWVWRNDEMLPGGKAAWINALQDCVSIPRQAQDPIRSILLIEVLNCNQEANDLIQRGIEGVNWTADEKGRSFVDIDAGQISFSINAWCFRNAVTYRDSIFIWPEYEEYDKLHRANTIGSPIEGFRFKSNDWQDFLSEVGTITAEYHNQLLMGMAEDPVTILENAKLRLLDAGVQEYLDALNEQFAIYWAEYTAKGGSVAP
jgi:putative aldouronate transport system substrate-binding protein